MKCKYCGEKAGFLSFAHKECKERHIAAIKSINDCIHTHFDNESGNYETVRTELQNTCSNGFVSEIEFENLVSQCVENRLQSNYKPYKYIESFIASMPSNDADRIHNSSAYSNYWNNIINETFKVNREEIGLLDNEKQTAIIKKDQLEIVEKIRKDGSDEMISNLEQNMVNYIGSVIDEALNDDLIDENEENNIFQLIKDLGLFMKDVLTETPYYRKLMQALVLRDLKENKPIERIEFDEVPVILGKNEFLVWGFHPTKGYEEKTKRVYQGRSKGVNIRICKGVYYKTGACKGYPVDQQYHSPLGTGCLIISNKNIFFVGNKSVKIPINKIISFTEYSDGIELVKDGANSHPYTFIGCDAWFIINAIQILAQ